MSKIAEQKIALNQFSEKLAALRQTMSKEEQSMLDAVVANSAFEVSAHGIAVNMAIPVNQAIPANQAINFAAVAKDADDVEDVQAHAAIATAAIPTDAAIPTENVVIQFNVATGYEVIPFGTTGAVPTGRFIK